MSQCQPCCRVGSYFLMGACAAAWCADPALRMNAVQAYMNIITTALISLDLSWVQDQIRQNESTGYSSLTRALVLASQAGRMTRLLRVMNLVGLFRVRASTLLSYNSASGTLKAIPLQQLCAHSGNLMGCPHSQAAMMTHKA